MSPNHKKFNLIKHELTRDQIGRGLQILAEEGIDHMIYAPIPDNHLFWYRGAGLGNPDYLARLKLLQAFGTELKDYMDIPAASQLLGIIPHTGSGAQHRRHIRLQEQLTDMSVILCLLPINAGCSYSFDFCQAFSQEGG